MRGSFLRRTWNFSLKIRDAFEKLMNSLVSTKPLGLSFRYWVWRGLGNFGFENERNDEMAPSSRS